MKRLEEIILGVSKIYEKHNIINSHTGRSFNIYSIANIERNEVSTHSRMIAELLNPKGSHGQKGKYLDLFCEQTGIPVTKEECDRASVRVEKTIQEGRLDIEIRFHNLYIVIENKIDAADQDRQIQRYYNHCKTEHHHCDYKILFLTKYGHTPSGESLGSIEERSENETSIYYDENGKKVNIEPISYKTDIALWIEKCLAQSLDLPNVHSGLRHYLNLVNKITGNSMSTTQRKEIIGFLLEGRDNFRISAALKIANICQSSALRGDVLFRFLTFLENKLISPGAGRRSIRLVDFSKELKDFQYDKALCIEWCEKRSKDKEKEKGKWQHKGFFLGLDDRSDFLLHVEVAKNALHYGFVPLLNDFDDVTKGALVKNGFECRNWGPKWFSKIAHDNLRSFDESAIELLCSETEIGKLSEKIVDDLSDLLGTLAPPTASRIKSLEA